MSAKMPALMASLVDSLYRSINRDPRLLLETDGGPVGMSAHVVIARLYGHDDQLDHEWRIDHAEPILHAPIPERLSPIRNESPFSPSLRTAEYILQTSYSVAGITLESVDSETLRWIDKKPRPDTHQYDILALRYRRR